MKNEESMRFSSIQMSLMPPSRLYTQEGSNACARHDNACARVIIPFHTIGGSAARCRGRRLFKLLPQSGGQFQHQLFATTEWIAVDAPEDNAQVVAQVRTVTHHQLAVDAL